MRDIIHIGYPRTASSWFQQFFYPAVQNYTFIARKVVQENLIHPLPGKYIPNWTSEFQSEKKKLLVSEEMILGKIRAGSANLFYLETHLQRIKESFNNPIIVVFLRRQPESIYSFYNLYIKKGGTFSLPKFLRQDLKLQESLLFSKWFFCYDLSLQLISKVFDKDAVKVYLYEDFATNPTHFLKAFSKELELNVDLSKLNFAKTNKSFTPIKLQAKRLTNRFTFEGIPFKQYFFTAPFAYNLFKKGNSKNYNIPENFLRHIDSFADDFALSNNKVLQDFNLPEMKKYNYPL